VIDSLAQSIAEMPLAPSALAGARDSAARLVQLLPTDTLSLLQGSTARMATPKWVPATILYFAFAVWMALNVFLGSRPSSDAPAPIEQSTATPAAAHPVTRSLTKGTAVAGSPVVPDR
jgi:hypothetical protein